MRSDDREQCEAAKAASEDQQLQMGREMISSATGGAPDFEGFAASLRSWANGTAKLFGEADNTGDIESLRTLAERVERVGERLGFL